MWAVSRMRCFTHRECFHLETHTDAHCESRATSVKGKAGKATRAM
jgi:hypothetical protein